MRHSSDPSSAGPRPHAVIVATDGDPHVEVAQAVAVDGHWMCLDSRHSVRVEFDHGEPAVVWLPVLASSVRLVSVEDLPDDLEALL